MALSGFRVTALVAIDGGTNPFQTSLNRHRRCHVTLIRRTNPLGELVSLRQAMDRLFEDSFIRPRSPLLSDEFTLPLDIRANGDEVVVEAALPGVKPEDVDVSVLGDTLTISASHRDETNREDDGYTYREIRRGSFSRTITLPSGVRADAASATFDNGMLTLRLPKAEEAKARQIPVTATAATPEGTSTTEQSA
jgi:HSP20 family protein